MGGIRERQIRSASAMLSYLLSTHGKSLGKESLLTLVVETEGILNSRPLLWKPSATLQVTCLLLRQTYLK